MHRSIAWSAIATPWGEFYGRAEGPNIVELRFPGLVPGEVAASTPMVDRLARELREYFQGTRRVFDLPLSLRGTEFQTAVWAELRKIPYGTTVSYSELARRVGRPRSARAVGQAVGANPIPILVPCHRVLPAAGGVGGFGPGPEWKRRLLALEGASPVSS
jgi:methylated-DNA-[protein]-cysteine S-methyltransferase